MPLGVLKADWKRCIFGCHWNELDVSDERIESGTEFQIVGTINYRTTVLLSRSVHILSFMFNEIYQLHFLDTSNCIGHIETLFLTFEAACVWHVGLAITAFASHASGLSSCSILG